MAKDLIADFGRRLRDLRRSANLSQTELARQIGLESPDSISRLERGEATGVSFDVLLGLVGLVERVGRDANWLLTGRAGTGRGPDRLEWLASATKSELIVDLCRLAQERTTVENLLRVVDDADAKAGLLREDLETIQNAMGEPGGRKR